MTKSYIGTKEILAWQQEEDGKPGYAVQYPDGHVSWSPKDVFEAAYHETEGEAQALTFGDAIHFLKLGKKVARSGWNGKGMWLSLSVPCGIERSVIPAASLWSENNRRYAEAVGGHATVLPCITMKTASGEILMGWLASQTDMLAEDWMVLPEIAGAA